MNLIEVYIQEVTRRLPEKNRGDIALELQSTIEDMLPENYSEQDVKAALAQLGSPAMLASGYLDRPMHLIGPRYYDVYMTLLKMILPIAAAIALITMISINVVEYDGEVAVLAVIITMIGEGIWGILSTSVQVFFWLTIIFTILERIDTGREQTPLTTNFKKWSPDDLKNILYIPKKKAISNGEVFASLLWTAIWATIYFNAANLLGVYEKGKEGLMFVLPTFNQEVLNAYWPFVVAVTVLEVGLAITKMISGRWTKKLAIFNVVYQLVVAIVFIIMISDFNLFNPDFVAYFSNLTSITNEFQKWILWGAIPLWLIFAAIDSYQGFRKASAK
ncbi:HAAS signaling domain-containing protein [Metabacillus rhizolycopersici]|uniref:Uncharacterized protein n=1 Tax=Metabacillus rhizolycopersici TaxID=2875709 RepID=A0ABS7UNM7_9BACI|nr:hypothetical protein [Metabacillus rhizolycopersici]MBZ5749499.1 hypothetical protein [Metabacillus rhizolycopersici]